MQLAWRYVNICFVSYHDVTTCLILVSYTTLRIWLSSGPWEPWGSHSECGSVVFILLLEGTSQRKLVLSLVQGSRSIIPLFPAEFSTACRQAPGHSFSIIS